VLGSGSNGRLFEEVRTRRGLSYGSYSSLDARSDTGLLLADAQTKHESADEVAQVILDEFAKLSAAPADEQALEKRRVYVSGAFAR
jgi:zinc protease